MHYAQHRRTKVSYLYAARVYRCLKNEALGRDAVGAQKVEFHKRGTSIVERLSSGFNASPIDMRYRGRIAHRCSRFLGVELES